MRLEVQSMDDLDDLEAIFITETFHRNDPIRAKPVRDGPLIERVWIKKKPTRTLNERFAQLMTLTDDLPDDHIGDDDDASGDDQFEDIEVDASLPTKDLRHRLVQRKHSIVTRLAGKLKKKAICNRLGVAYKPGKSSLTDTRARLGTTKSWSEKFGQLLAAKKLLYLPLLHRKYNCGPRMTKDELDIEIDLYMSEVKKSKQTFKKALTDINNIANGIYNTDRVQKISSEKLFSGFGGPGWKKKLCLNGFDIQTKSVLKEELDMEIDDYMKGSKKNDENNNNENTNTNSSRKFIVF